MDILSAPRFSTASASARPRIPPGDAEWDIQHRGDLVHPAPVYGTPVGTGRDVVKDELVRALVPVTGRQPDDIAHHPMVAEPNPFDDHTVSDVQAGDYPFGKNDRISSSESLPSRRALPEMAQATPVAARSPRSRLSRTPPEA